jgi:hypothetical protein
MYDDIRPALDADDFVEGVLIRRAMSVIYGESNAGKTFFASDLAFHIATGREWFGRAVDQGGVLYCALEGGFGIRNRIAALRSHYGVDNHNMPLAVVPVAVNLLDPAGDIASLIETIRQVRVRCDFPIVATFVDTLSRALAGGNENSSESMGALVTNGTRIQQVTGSHLAWIHHCGKDQAKGARGHSLLRAATDTEIEVSAGSDGRRLARITKQRDLPCDGEFAFKLKVIDLGRNRRGKPITSCVVEKLAEPTRTGPRLSVTERTARDFLADLTLAEGMPLPHGYASPGLRGVPEERWRAECDSRRLSTADTPDGRSKAFRRASNALLDAGVVAARAGLVWLTRPDPAL